MPLQRDDGRAVANLRKALRAQLRNKARKHAVVERLAAARERNDNKSIEWKAAS